MEFEIRFATPADIPTLARHRADMFVQMDRLLPAEHAGMVEATIRHLDEVMPAGEYLAWVVHKAGQPFAIVGGGGILLQRILPSITYERKMTTSLQALVMNVFTEPEHRRQGLARRVMHTLHDYCRTNNIIRIVLHASDEGRPLYESLGYLPTNEMRLKVV
jgi:GNAT superfamily N-acetyltransferase